MELSGGPRRATGSLADYRKELVDRIVHQTVADLAQEKGIAPEGGRRWSRLVAQAERTALAFEKNLPPTQEAREIGIEDLRPLARQPVRVRILRGEEAPDVENRRRKDQGTSDRPGD